MRLDLVPELRGLGRVTIETTQRVQAALETAAPGAWIQWREADGCVVVNRTDGQSLNASTEAALHAAASGAGIFASTTLGPCR